MEQAKIQVKLELSKESVDRITAQINELREKIAEAKTLAGELASLLDGLRLHFDVGAE